MMSQESLELNVESDDRVSLCETLDRVLNKGVVLAGEVLISVAGIDLIYLGLQVMLTSVETARSLSAGELSPSTIPATGTQP